MNQPHTIRRGKVMTIKDEHEKMKQTLIYIRTLILNEELTDKIKLMYVFHYASQALDERAKLLNDIRSGAK